MTTPAQPRLILASRSPRRRELLRDAGYEFDIVVPGESAESGVCTGESPAELVARLAKQKAMDVARRRGDGIVLGCDTVVECRGRILGKPSGAEDARAMLVSLRGREHAVYSGLCLWRRPDDRVLVDVAATRLAMDAIPDAAIGEYLASGAWEGKAGAFGYQDRLGWIHIVEGSESNVVGLPIELLATMLDAIQRP
jgi:septum formation protein